MPHHAYIYEGLLSQLTSVAESARKEFGFANPADPDVRVLEIEKFGIEEARELVQTAGLKSVSGRALYVLGVSSINSDAQQALLKLLEEPQEGTVFVLLAPHGAIMPTLRSRFIEYPERLQENAKQKVLESPVSRRPLAGRPLRPDHFALHFLAATGTDRSEQIAKLLKDEEGAKERVREFLQMLEEGLHARLHAAKDKKNIVRGLEDIARVRLYANDRSPSFKMLLEHLAIALPVIKPANVKV